MTPKTRLLVENQSHPFLQNTLCLALYKRPQHPGSGQCHFGNCDWDTRDNSWNCSSRWAKGGVSNQ